MIFIYDHHHDDLFTLSMPPAPLWGALGLREMSDPRRFSTPSNSFDLRYSFIFLDQFVQIFKCLRIFLKRWWKSSPGRNLRIAGQRWQILGENQPWKIEKSNHKFLMNFCSVSVRPFAELLRWNPSSAFSPFAGSSFLQDLRKIPNRVILSKFQDIYHFGNVKKGTLTTYYIDLRSQWHFECSYQRHAWSPKAQTWSENVEINPWFWFKPWQS